MICEYLLAKLRFGFLRWAGSFAPWCTHREATPGADKKEWYIWSLCYCPYSTYFNLHCDYKSKLLTAGFTVW